MHLKWKKREEEILKIGDLVRYRGWGELQPNRFGKSGPLGVVIEMRGNDLGSIHTRIRVMWAGEEIPIQAKVLSVEGGRTTSWIHPKNFEIVCETQ
jgi:hypothetical protein